MESSKTSVLASVKSLNSESGQYVAVLDKTVFHPQGGGQPCDQGTIGSARVLSVKERDGVIEHYLDRPVELGMVELQVDEAIRKLHSVLHSVGHLIGNIGSALGWRPVKAHHWPHECKVEFLAEENGVEALTEEQFHAALMALIEQNLVLKIQIGEDGTRLVGFGNLDLWPCGGTHVNSLAELPESISIKVKKKRDRMIVRYDIGKFQGE